MITSQEEAKRLVLNAKLAYYQDDVQEVFRITRSPEDSETKAARISLADSFFELSKLINLKETERTSLFYGKGEGYRTATTPPEVVRLDLELKKHRAERAVYLESFKQMPWPMSFLEAGEAIRLVLPILGKFNWYGAISEEFNTKIIGWTDPIVTEEKVTEVASVLIENGIRKFDINDQFRLVINIPKDVYCTSFYSSPDPEIWKQKNDIKAAKIEIQKKVREVCKKLDGK